jgi:hypothetical protein
MVFTISEEAFSPQKRTEHPELQKTKFMNFFLFCGKFLPSDPDPNPEAPLNPDPQHWE